MATSVANAKTILEADGTLTALATGGIYDWDELGRMGLNRSNSASSAAFDSSGIIKPCLVLRLSASDRVDGVADNAAPTVAVRDVMQVWGYQDSGFSTITSMLDRVFVLLQGQQLGGFECLFLRKVQPPVRDIEVDANVEHDDYEVFRLR